MSSPSTTSTLIARIPYLNTEPFYHRFSAQGYELVDLPPRELGRQAALGRIAAGPMSVVDYFRLSDTYEPLGPFGIAAAGPVHSVLLFSKRPVPELNGGTIAVTDETSTSVELLRLLFRRHYDVTPAAWRRGFDDPADAVLLIGDEALRRAAGRHDDYPVVLDLSAAWWEWKKLPFVFALWVVRKTLPLEEKKVLSMRFEDAFYEGFKDLATIGTKRAPGLNMTPAAVEDYLRNFRYRLGPEDWDGLNEFRRLYDSDIKLSR
jgi:chorismate dehydratase